MLTWNKAEKAKKKQDITDSLLRTAYPFISEGKGLTSSLASLELPYNLNLVLMPQFLPEGEEDAAYLTIGQLEGKSFALWVWRDGELAICKPSTGPSWAWKVSAKIVGNEVTLKYSSGLLSNIEHPRPIVKEIK